MSRTYHTPDALVDYQLLTAVLATLLSCVGWVCTCSRTTYEVLVAAFFRPQGTHLMSTCGMYMGLEKVRVCVKGGLCGLYVHNHSYTHPCNAPNQ